MTGADVAVWHPAVDMAYRIASLTPGVLATLLFTALGPRLWRRIVVDGCRFSIARIAVADLVSVVLVHFVMIEVFLAIGLGLLRWFEPDFPYLDEIPGLAVTAPLSSLPIIGRFSPPVGTAIAIGAALYCQRQLALCKR